MRALTRAAAYLLAVLALMSAVAFLAVLWTDGAVEAGVGGALETSLVLSASETVGVVMTVVALVLLVLPAVLVLAFWPREERRVEVGVAGMESVHVPAGSLERHIEAQVREVPQVRTVRAEVTQESQGLVGVSLDVSVDEDADTGALVNRVEERVTAALESPYGIALRGKPGIALHRAGGRERARRAA